MPKETVAIKERSPDPASRPLSGVGAGGGSPRRRRSLIQRERALALLWERAHTLSDGLITEDGRRFRVVYPGRPSGRAGPDFRDSVISTDTGRLIVGDVELHIEAPDWGSHGHGRDPNYNGVILHVVLRAKGRVSTNKQSKTSVPVASLEPVVGLLDKAEGPDSHSAFPWSDMPASALRDLLDRAGDRRFIARSRGFAEEMERGDAPQQLYSALFEALGYAANRRPFRRLAHLVPLSTIATLRGEPGGTRLLAIQALLLNAAGLLSFKEAGEQAPSLDGLLAHLPRTGRLPDGAWQLFRVRPANHPARRVIGAARLMDRFIDTGPVATLETSIDPRAPALLVQRLAAPPYIGVSRAREMAVNVVLPFMHALAGLRRDMTLGTRCLEVYRSFPGLADNEITRETKRLLTSQSRSVTIEGARRHQGLIHIYNVMTRPEAAGSEWPLLSRAAGVAAYDAAPLGGAGDR